MNTPLTNKLTSQPKESAYNFGEKFSALSKTTFNTSQKAFPNNQPCHAAPKSYGDTQYVQDIQLELPNLS